MATLALAKEFAPQVRVNGIAPGAILWPDDGSVDLKKRNEVMDKIPLKKMGDVDDICTAVEYLIKAKYVTGQVINVDGGRSLNQ